MTRPSLWTSAIGAHLVAVRRGLVGALDGDVDVRRLLRGELGELHADLLEVERRNLLVEAATIQVA